MFRRRRIRGVGPVEALESRTLLTGNLNVTVVDGIMTIAGDEASNSATLRRNEELGALELVGADGTTINGSAEPFKYDPFALRDPVGQDMTLNGPVLNLSINLQGGNDSLTTAEINFGGSYKVVGPIQIDGGDGDDRIKFDYLQALAAVEIEGGTGDDFIDLSGFYQVSLTVHGQAGNDFLALSGGRTLGLLDFSGNDGDDQIHFGEISIEANVLISGGNGNDIVAITGCGIGISTTITADVTIELGAGDDLLALGGVGAFDRLTITSGTGTDKILFGVSDVGDLNINSPVTTAIVPRGVANGGKRGDRTTIVTHLSNFGDLHTDPVTKHIHKRVPKQAVSKALASVFETERDQDIAGQFAEDVRFWCRQRQPGR